MFDIKKFILHWCLITIGILLTLSFIVIFAISIFSPISMAKLCYNVGFGQLETFFYFKDYEKNGEISSLYKVVINNYNFKNYDDVEKYYEILEENDRYNTFIEYINEQNENMNTSNLNKSALLNEDNYLKNRYVLSLIYQNKWDKAFNYALENFVNYETYTLKNAGNYLFYHLIDSSNDDVLVKFLDNNGFEESLYNEIVHYIYQCIANFNDGFEEYNEVDSPYFIALNTRIRQVYLNIQTLSEKYSIAIPSDLDSSVNGISNIVIELL